MARLPKSVAASGAKNDRPKPEETTSASASSRVTTAPVECVDSPFRIVYTNPASRSSSVDGRPPLTTELLPDELGTSCVVQPKRRWDELGRFRRFVVSEEEFAERDFIFVNHSGIHDGDQSDGDDATPFWIARVLEIRAMDDENVYLRIYWAYWPEELPGGRRPHQPSEELVLSNHMEVISAMTVAGKAEVQHWREQDDEENPTGLFWRQNYTFQDQRLSRIKEHCRCRGPHNPDQALVYCDQDTCKFWLHEECILRDVLSKAYGRLNADEASEAGFPGRVRQKRKVSLPEADPWQGVLEATLNKADPTAPLRVIVTNLRGDGKKAKTKKTAHAAQPTSWEEAVCCLNCGETIN